MESKKGVGRDLHKLSQDSDTVLKLYPKETNWKEITIDGRNQHVTGVYLTSPSSFLISSSVQNIFRKI